MNEGVAPRAPDEAHTRYLDGLKKCTAHKELAIAAALHYCAAEHLIRRRKFASLLAPPERSSEPRKSENLG